MTLLIGPEGPKGAIPPALWVGLQAMYREWSPEEECIWEAESTGFGEGSRHRVREKMCQRSLPGFCQVGAGWGRKGASLEGGTRSGGKIEGVLCDI